MKPIDSINKCQHCKEDIPGLFECDQISGVNNFTDCCSMQDYLVCPLKGHDDKDIRTGKRK